MTNNCVNLSTQFRVVKESVNNPRKSREKSQIQMFVKKLDEH